MATIFAFISTVCDEFPEKVIVDDDPGLVAQPDDGLIAFHAEIRKAIEY